MSAINMNEKQFQALMAEGKTLLVEYWAPWCTYCRRISAAYDQVAQQNEEKLVAARINIDQEPLLAQQEQIEVIPTLVLYRDGRIMGSIVAPGSKAVIDRFIEETLSSHG